MADLALLALALVAVAAVIVISRRDDDGNDMRGERDIGPPEFVTDGDVSGGVPAPRRSDESPARTRSDSTGRGDDEEAGHV